MAFHQAMKQQELEQDGLSAADARAAARREMGNITRAREDSRGVWIASWLESVWQDVVYALRSLRRQPAFTFAALAALVLGIGLNSSAFTLFNADRPAALARTRSVAGRQNLQSRPGPQGRRQGVGGFGIAEYRYLRDHTRTFSRLDHHAPGRRPARSRRSGPADLVRIRQRQLLRRARRRHDARTRLPARRRSTAAPRAVAVISHRLWTRLLNSDPAVLGRTLRLEDVPFTIVGVAAPEFIGSSQGGAQDLWLPLSALRLMTADQANATRRAGEAGVLLLVHGGTARARRHVGDRPRRTRRPQQPLSRAVEDGSDRRRALQHVVLRASELAASPDPDLQPDVRHGPARAAARLRQRRQSPARARHGAAPRDCDQALARREPRPRRPPAADRGHGPRAVSPAPPRSASRTSCRRSCSPAPRRRTSAIASSPIAPR